MDRVILHADCNSFYASVESVFHPEWERVPMAVCGSPENRHGIILAKNEQAKKYRIQTAEPIWQAKQKCPELVLVPAHHDRYASFSRRINAIYQEYTDLVEPFSIDESWLDVTGTTHLFGDGIEIADILRKRIREEVGVTISVGVSFNKVFAKLGSDYKKPDATTVITRENVKRILFPLPVRDMLLVGESAFAALQRLHIRTIGDLAQYSREKLVQMLGKLGGTLSDYANGLDTSPVRAVGEREELKSIGNSQTYKRDLTGYEDIRLGITTLADTVSSRLRKHGLKGGTIQITIKNPSLKAITRQTTLAEPTNLAGVIREAAFQLIRENWNSGAPIRLLGITASGLVREEDTAPQISFFHETRQVDKERQERLERTLDSIREKHGENAVSIAGAIHNDIGVQEPAFYREGVEKEW